MAASALILTYLGGWSFTGLVVVCAVVLCWEWSGLVRKTQFDISLYLHIITIVLAGILMTLSQPYWSLLALITGAIGIASMSRSGQRPWLSALGVAYIGLPAVALIWFRADEPYGFLTIIYLFTIVWTSDTAAYFFGRSIGGPKLAPVISPNKTWAGLIGGAITSALTIIIFNYYASLDSLAVLVMFGIILAIVSQMGDLAESGLKRQFNIKDSSHLIPGHGGLLDRVDALIFAILAAAAIALIKEPSMPAKAILVWS